MLARHRMICMPSNGIDNQHTHQWMISNDRQSVRKPAVVMAVAAQPRFNENPETVKLRPEAISLRLEYPGECLIIAFIVIRRTKRRECFLWL